MKPESTPLKGPIRLELKLIPHRVETTKFESVVLTRRYEKGQLLNERTEITDFAVKTTHESAQSPTGPFLFRVKTVSKDGMADLHDLAFPELSEAVELQITPQGDILSAGLYTKDSIFFVPSLSLPAHPVAVGDTWTLQRRWYSLKGGLPMQFDVVSIFKNAFVCGASTCAEVEIAGVVGLKAEAADDVTKQKGSMQSDLSGRYVFDIQNGSVLWSDIRDTEHLVSGDWKIDVRSCLVEALQEPVADRWRWFDQVKCDPSQDVPTRVPGF